MVKIGDVVTVKITAIDEEKKRISLSMRAAAEETAAPEDAGAEEVVYTDEAPAEPASADGDAE